MINIRFDVERVDYEKSIEGLMPAVQGWVSGSEKMQELKDAFIANRPVYIDAEKTGHSYRVKVVTIDYDNPLAYAVGHNWSANVEGVYRIAVD